MAQPRALRRSSCHCLKAGLQDVARGAAQRLLVLHLQLRQKASCLGVSEGKLAWVLRWVSWHRCLWLCGRSLRHHWHGLACCCIRQEPCQGACLAHGVLVLGLVLLGVLSAKTRDQRANGAEGLAFGTAPSAAAPAPRELAGIPISPKALGPRPASASSLVRPQSCLAPVVEQLRCPGGSRIALKRRSQRSEGRPTSFSKLSGAHPDDPGTTTAPVCSEASWLER